MMKALRFTFAVAAVICVGCGTVTEPEPEPQPSLRDAAPTAVGPIVGLDLRIRLPGELPTIGLRESGDRCGVIYSIPDGTPIQRKNSQGVFVDVPLENLRKGVTVAVWATGVTLMSCPTQAGASAIEVF